MSTAVAGWFAISIMIAQSCAAPAQYGAPYGSISSSPVGASGSLSNTASASTTPDVHLDTTGYTADQASSDALSTYLKRHRLPLVGAQVLKGPAQQRAVVLYGYVGSDFGKRDAVTKARSYLADPSLQVDNRIKVKPELLAAGSSATGSAQSDEDAQAGSSANATAGAAGNSQYPGISSYEQQQGDPAQAYAQQQNPSSSTMSAVAPLLMFGLMALSMTSGGSLSLGPGSFSSSPFGSSPFGYPGSSSSFGAPYNPYPGFPSPSPYGSTVPPYGGTGSPYTSAPSPYGP